MLHVGPSDLNQAAIVCSDVARQSKQNSYSQMNNARSLESMRFTLFSSLIGKS